MKKFAILGLVLVSSAAWASHTPSVSDNASNSACFGQARAAIIHMMGGANWGALAAERRGDNATLNAEYRAFCSG